VERSPKPSLDVPNTASEVFFSVEERYWSFSLAAPSRWLMMKSSFTFLVHRHVLDDLASLWIIY